MLINFLIKRPLIGLFLFTVLISAKNQIPVVSTIDIEGNQKTEDYILEREIRHPIDTPLDTNIVIEDRNRLENLGLFSQVKWQIIPIKNDSVQLLFRVIESINKTPPIAFPTFDEDTGWSFVGLWLMKNFRGKNQSLSLSGSIGGKDTYGLSFSDPWIFGDHVSLSIDIGRTLYGHRFLNKDVDLNNVFLSFGKWFGSKIKTSIGIEVESKTFIDNNQEDINFFYFAPVVNVKFDTRDIFWNPSKGVLVSQYIHHRQGIESKKWYLTYWSQSYSWFYKLNKQGKQLIFAVNGTLNSKIGEKDIYWLNYFGNSFNIRGWSLPDSDLYLSSNQDFRFGHESIHASFELRKEIIPKFSTSLGIELGLIFVLFSDIGIIGDEWDDLKNKMPMYGTGLGIRIPFPLVGVIRVDYGWGCRDNIWNTGTLHFGIGQKF